MTETQKLRNLLGQLDLGPHPVCSREGQEQERQSLLARINAQSVLALEEQIASYQRSVPQSTLVQCRVCRGTGHGSGYELTKPCPGCHGSGLVRV